MLAFNGVTMWPVVAAVWSALFLALAMIVLAMRKRKGSGEPSCGKCGYGVRGLPTFTCPECGSDLRQVGIVSTGGGNPIAIFFAALASSWKRMVVFSLAIIALLALAMYGSIAFILSHDVFPSTEVVLDPASKSYRAIVSQGGDAKHVSGSFAARGDRIFGKNLVVQLTKPDQAPDHNTVLDIDLDTWSSRLYHWTGGTSPNVTASNFNREELEKFFKEKKIDTSAPAVSAEIDTLMLLIDGCRTASLLRLAPTTARFTVASSVNKTVAQLNSGGSPPGMFFLCLGAGFWLLTMTGVVIARMFKISGPRLPNLGANELVVAPPSLQPGGHVARTLTILFSDIKDFTARSAATSRSGAVELARRHRELAASIIRQRRGNLVKTIGDALLVTFDSATDAVLAGLSIQTEAAAQNASANDGDALQLRIAVATGEVIVEAGDVYGETVNLASRLQGIAAPGQVVVSAATCVLINNREVQTEPFGEHQLAGFKSPVQVFIAKPMPAAATR